MEVEIAEKLWREHGFLDLWKLRIEYLNGSDENSWKIGREPELKVGVEEALILFF
jgi:hypothetical protein